MFPFLFALCANVNKVLIYKNISTIPNVNERLKYKNVASSSDVNALLKKTITFILTSQSATSRLVNKMLKYKSVGVSLFSWGAVLLLWEKQHIFAYIRITEYDIFICYVSYYYLIIKKNNNLWGFPNWMWKQIKRGIPTVVEKKTWRSSNQ